MAKTPGVRQRGRIWYIDYYAGGKRYVETVGPSYKDAVAVLGGIKNDIREGRWFPRKMRNVPFDKLADQYANLKKGKTGKEKLPYIGQIRKFFAGRMVQDIGVLEVEQFKEYIMKLPKRGGGKRGASDVNHHLDDLRAILNKAIQWENIERNPAVGGKVQRLPKPPGRNEYLTVEQAGRLLDACHPHLRPIVLCALETGMRKSEILGLRWKEIRNNMIYLPGERTKNGKPREIPISERLMVELQRIRRHQSKGNVLDTSGIVFKAVRGTPSEDETRRLKVLSIGIKDFRSAWKAAKERAGIAPGFHFHDLRHTFASHQKMAGVDDYTLMELLGHSDFTMMKRYAHLTPEHKRKAVEMLPDWNSGNILGGGIPADA